MTAEAANAQDRDAHLEPNAFFDTFLHDLRSLLSVAHGFTRLLVERGAEFEPDRRQDLLGIVDRSLTQLAAITTSAGSLTQLVGALDQSTPEPVDVDSLVRSVVERLDLDSPIDETLSGRAPILTLHRALVEDAVAALVDNARLHTPVGTRIHVTVTEPDPGTAVIRVEDNGPGVPAHLRERIFDAFDRGDAPPSRSGAGLGLALTLFVARAHRGDAWVEEVDGGGAAFRVLLCSLPIPDTNP